VTLLTRQHLADPLYGVPYLERLRRASAMDLRDNARVVDLGDGYVRVEAVDPTKMWGQEATP
jgi:hypothetical protein